MYKKFKFMKFPTKLLVTFCCMAIILGIYQNKAKGNAESSFVINAKTIGIIKDKKTKKNTRIGFHSWRATTSNYMCPRCDKGRFRL